MPEMLRFSVLLGTEPNAHVRCRWSDVLVTCSVAVFLLLPRSGVAQRTEDPCAGRGTAVLLLTSSHELRLCEAGATHRLWRVALGSGGVGKTREGDRKTPLGTYPLGVPRPSPRFGTFIPIGYPTPEQARLGYTGSAIGIHGPLRASRGLGFLNVLVDWTLGCVAVESDPAIQEIAEWVRKNAAATAVIL